MDLTGSVALAPAIAAWTAALVAWFYSGVHGLIWVWWGLRGQKRNTHLTRALVGAALFVAFVVIGFLFADGAVMASPS